MSEREPTPQGISTTTMHQIAQEKESLTLPFFADDLPESLPSEHLILNPSEILTDGLSRKVVRVGKHFVVKYGEHVTEMEAATMMYLRKKTSVSTPKLYAAYKSESNSMIYIITEYIDGYTLLKAWASLTDLEKTSIMSCLKQNIEELREIPDDGYFGGIGYQHMPNGIFWAADSDDPILISGPFENEPQLNEALARRSDHMAEFNGRKGRKGDFYRRMLPKVLKGHRPIFTHGDFQRKNIMIRPRSVQKSDPEATEDLSSLDEAPYDVFIIDWENAGWYPDYWEYCAASWSFIFDDDWADWLEQILTPYPVEYPWLQMIGNELWS